MVHRVKQFFVLGLLLLLKTEGQKRVRAPDILTLIDERYNKRNRNNIAKREEKPTSYVSLYKRHNLCHMSSVNTYLSHTMGKEVFFLDFRCVCHNCH